MLKLNLTFFLYFTFKILQINATAGPETDMSLDPRIINGTFAELNSVRHQVSIRRREYDDQEFGKGHICGGSLISNNVVLTAAHCFVSGGAQYDSDNMFVVVMGNLDRFQNNNNTLRFDISKTIRGSFNEKFDGDIALVILNGTVPANHPTVQPITLNERPLKKDTLCQATGWGVTEEGDLSRFLRTVDVPIIDFDDCRNKTTYKSRIREGMLCAGYLEGGRDSCVADSGGPLVFRGIQAGITSWGKSCASPLRPGVYTDVAYYKNWILEQLTNYNASLPKFAPVADGVPRLTLCSLIVCVSLIINFVR